MIGLSALEAHREATLAISSVVFSFDHKSVAVGSCTPLHIGVCIDINVFLELQVLLENLLRTELSNIFSRILSRAASVRTFDSFNFSIGNIESYIVSHAIQAESMRALLNTMEVFIIIVFIAYIASSSTLCHWLNLSLSWLNFHFAC